MFNLYVALELLTFAAVPLACLDGRASTLLAAMRYLLFALLGTAFYLLGATLIYGAFGALDTKSPRLCRGMLARPSIKYSILRRSGGHHATNAESVRNKIQRQTRPLIRAHQQHACFLYRETSSKTPLLPQSARRRESNLFCPRR